MGIKCKFAAQSSWGWLIHRFHAVAENRIQIRKKSFRIHILHKLISRSNFKNKVRVCRTTLLRRTLINRFHAVAETRSGSRKNHFGVHWPNSLALLVVVLAQLLQLLNAIRLDRIHNLKNRVINHKFKSGTGISFLFFCFFKYKKAFSITKKLFLKFHH